MKIKINYQKEFDKNGYVYNQTITITNELKKQINSIVEEERKLRHFNYKHYQPDYNYAKIYLDTLDNNYNYINLTTLRFIIFVLSMFKDKALWDISDKDLSKIKNDRNTVVKVVD